MRRIPATIFLLLASAQLRGAELPKPARAFIEARCIECHDAETKKGGLNFNALSTQLDEPPTEAKWTLIFDRVQRGEMPPKKKEKPPADEVAVFMESLGGFLSEHDAARHASSGRVVLRRLNRTEYENTLHDLLSIDTPLAQMLPEDASAYGFDNVSEGLRLSATQIDSYLVAADAALDAAITLRHSRMSKSCTSRFSISHPSKNSSKSRPARSTRTAEPFARTTAPCPMRWSSSKTSCGS